MSTEAFGRRSFLRKLGAAGVAGSLPGMAMAEALADGAFGPRSIVEETVEAQPTAAPPYSIGFAVCGMSHDHIYHMVDDTIRGGGKLLLAYAHEPDKIAAFKKRYPDVRFASSVDEILNDKAVQLVLSSEIASERAPLGVRVMKSGKDFLSDKPGITTLEQLAAVRKTIAETGRIYAVQYSELLDVKAAIKAGELVREGAIGKVIQTINIAPHQITQRAGDAGGSGGRPDWFWNDVQFGGILCDIGSHQIDQFLYYTGSTTAEVVASQVANCQHPNHPHFQDFGDMMLRGNGGAGYVRLDWFTPYGLGTWGDGRLFILGTDGYMEARKYTNIGVSNKGDNLFLVNQKEARSIDCSNVVLPFGPMLVADVVNRTHTAQDQAQCLLAAELSIKAQRNATRIHFDWEKKA